MDIAVIGGGAAGLAAAWSLDLACHVTLFERASVLGGHIRTVGGNVRSASVPADLRLDTGVIEFERKNFTTFHAWMEALHVPVADLHGGATCLHRLDASFMSDEALRESTPGHVERAIARARLIPLAVRARRFLRHARGVEPASLREAHLDDFIGDDDFGVWTRSLLMYAYSLPYDEVADVSATIAVPMLERFLGENAWTRIPGGVAAYVERVASLLRARIVCDARIRGVRRERMGVRIEHEDGTTVRFDHVIIAVPPHRVLDLLTDATEHERRCFGAFEGGDVETILHTDTSLYERRGITYFSEFDLFERRDGGYGYNAYLNRLSGLSSDGPVHYGLAFDMRDEIRASHIVHRTQHDVASYTREALACRDAIVANNGVGNTWFAGAYLGDGLHEGAIRSAFDVTTRLSGIVPLGVSAR